MGTCRHFETLVMPSTIFRLPSGAVVTWAAWDSWPTEHRGRIHAFSKRLKSHAENGTSNRLATYLVFATIAQVVARVECCRDPK